MEIKYIGSWRGDAGTRERWTEEAAFHTDYATVGAAAGGRGAETVATVYAHDECTSSTKKKMKKWNTHIHKWNFKEEKK